MLSRFSTLILCAALLLPSLPVAAAQLSAGDLIKSPDFSDLYYYGQDGKRYVFPNEQIYFSWYDTFNVKTISIEELGQIPFGNVVHYRPGVHMIKVTTDPKVYAVSHGGVLRWIQTEEIAAQLYGSNWAQNVHDLSDAFFSSYTVGDSINNVSSFAVITEQTNTQTISVDLNLTTPIEPVVPPVEDIVTSITLTASKTSVQAGDVVTLQATAQHANGIRSIEFFFEGILSKTCLQALCSDEVVIPLSGTKESYIVRALATTITNTTFETTQTLTVANGSSNLVSLSLSKSFVRQNQYAEAIVESDISIAVLRTDIYVNDSSVKACASAIRQCRWTDTFNTATGTTYEIYGVVKDTLGRTYTTAVKTLTIADNDSPTIDIYVEKEAIYVGETLDVQGTASDYDGVEKIEILKNGVVISTCQSVYSCAVTLGPIENAGIILVQARATDGLGLSEITKEVSVIVSVPL